MKYLDALKRWLKGSKEICPICKRPLPGKSLVNFDSKTHKIEIYNQHDMCRREKWPPQK